MKFTIHFALLVAVGLFAATGCKPSADSTAQSGGANAEAEHGHEHGPDGHDHAGGHGAGPHDGAVTDWGGGKFHVEFTVSHDKKEATVFILASDEKTPAPIDAEEIQLSITDPKMQVTMKASPQEGDPAGKASRFVGNHESLGVVQEYAGTISGVADGTPYSGDFAEVAHGDHDH